MSVKLVQHSDGSASIGAEINGEYVPFASKSAASLGHHAERMSTLRESAEIEGEAGQPARDVLAALAPASSASKPKNGGS